MKTLYKACLAGLMIFIGVPAFAEDQAAAPAATAADPARVAAAKELMEVTGVKKQLDGMMDMMKQSVAKGAAASGGEDAGAKAAAAVDQASKHFLVYKDDMVNDFAGLYAETFTAEEMKTVAEFYKSGPGAKFISMMPQLMQKGGAIGLKYSQRMINDLKAGTLPPADKK